MKNILLDFDLDNWEAILLSTLPALLNLFIFIYVRIKFPIDKVSRIFSLFLLALVVFQIGDTFLRMSNTIETAVLWNSIFTIGVLSIAPIGLQFCLLYTGKRKLAESFLVQFLLFAPVPIFIILTFLNQADYHFYPSSFWGWVYKEDTISVGAVQGYWIGAQGLIMLFLLVCHIFKVQPKSAKQKQTIIIAIGFSIPLLQGICTEILLPLTGTAYSIPLTSATMTFFSIAILIALKKYNLFSITESLKTKTILEAMTDVLIILSPDKKIQYINKQGELALGVDNFDKEYLNIENFFVGGKPEADNFTEKLFIPVLAGEKILDYSTEFVSKNGQKISVLISATSFKTKIGKPQILLLIHNISDLIHTGQQLAMREEQLKDKSEELNSFFYRTTHDLKGPIASIIGLTRLTKKEPDALMVAQCIDKIEMSASRLNNILLDFIKVMHIKENTPEVELINFYTMAESIIQSIKYSTDRDIVSFKVCVEPNIMFHSDKTLLDSILYNLVANAVNYRKRHADEEDESYVHIQVRSFGNEIMMKVCDNGIGIKKDIQSKIFNLFFRGNEDSKGTGLGLYILKNAIVKLNGRVELESEINKGSTFTVYVPNINPNKEIERPFQVYSLVS